MSIATGSRQSIGYIVETTYGTTPSTPSLVELPVVSFTGDLQANALEDNTLRSNRQKVYARRGNVATEGSIDVVMRPTNYDALLEAVLMGSWSSDVLKVGTTKRSFSIEQAFMDMPSAAQYRVFRGSVLSRLTMNVTTDQLVTAAFGFSGKDATALSSTSVDSNGYTAAASTDGFFHEGGTFNEGGSSSGILTNISLELNNNVTNMYSLGTTGAYASIPGKVTVTGTVGFLFTSATLYNKFVNNTESSLSFTLASGGHSLAFALPKVRYLTGSIPVNSDGPIVGEMTFEAIYDSGSDTVMSITRVVP